MLNLCIENSKGPKTRRFEATLLAHIETSVITSTSKVTRPAWMLLGGTQNELRPFIANLQSGHKAEVISKGYRSKDKFELLKTFGYHYTWQKSPHGATVLIYLPEFFCLDPGMVDQKVSFIVLPAKDWLVPNKDIIEYITKLEGAKYSDYELDWLSGIAPIFINYMDRRTRCPLLTDPRFHAQVLHYALQNKLAHTSGSSWNSAYSEVNTKQMGYAEGLFFHSSHDILEDFLSSQVRLFYLKQGVANG